MWLKVTGGIAGLALAFMTSGLALAQEQQTPAPLTASSVTIENNAAHIVAMDPSGASHTLVIDLSQLSPDQRQAIGMWASSEMQEASGQAGGGATGPSMSQGEAANVTTGSPATVDENQAVDVPPSSFSAGAAGTFGQPGDAGANGGLGHATDSSNNTMGSISEGLGNQNYTQDEESNGGSQPNEPAS